MRLRSDFRARRIHNHSRRGVHTGNTTPPCRSMPELSRFAGTAASDEIRGFVHVNKTIAEAMEQKELASANGDHRDSAQQPPSAVGRARNALMPTERRVRGSARWAHRRAPGTCAPDRGGLRDPVRRAKRVAAGASVERAGEVRARATPLDGNRLRTVPGGLPADGTEAGPTLEPANAAAYAQRPGLETSRTRSARPGNRHKEE